MSASSFNQRAGLAIAIAMASIAFAASSVRADDWLNVKTGYGAVGNGTTDDTMAIQSAITAAANATNFPNGAVVYFPAGTYLVSSTLTTGATTQPVSFLGDGVQSNILRAASFTTGDTLDLIGINGGSRMLHPLVEKLFFTSQAAWTAGATIMLQDTEQATIRDVRIGTSTFGPYTGIQIVGGLNNHVTHSYIGNATAIGIQLTGTPHAGSPIDTFLDNLFVQGSPNSANNISQVALQIEDGVSGVYATSCSFTQGSRGVYVKSAGVTPPLYLFFAQIDCDGNHDEAWRFEACKIVKLTSCRANSSQTNSGFNITAGTDFRFVDCTGTGNDQHGLYLNGGTEIVVDGGVYGSNISNGVEVLSGTLNFSIYGTRAGSNSVWGTATQVKGIHVGTSCNYYIIQGTRTTGNSMWGLQVESSGSNSSVTGNI